MIGSKISFILDYYLRLCFVLFTGWTVCRAKSNETKVDERRNKNNIDTTNLFPVIMFAIFYPIRTEKKNSLPIHKCEAQRFIDLFKLCIVHSMLIKIQTIIIVITKNALWCDLRIYEDFHFKYYFNNRRYMNFFHGVIPSDNDGALVVFFLILNCLFIEFFIIIIICKFLCLCVSSLRFQW